MASLNETTVIRKARHKEFSRFKLENGGEGKLKNSSSCKRLEMCVPRKKASGSKKSAKGGKKKSGKQQKSSQSPSQPSPAPTAPKKGESPAKKEEKAPNKGQEINSVEENPGENILAKPCASKKSQRSRCTLKCHLHGLCEFFDEIMNQFV
ncbi:unnamed protein product [Cylicocyclus nassatus]|uniref:Uncharacterized protein n=1 Tax=Cylicocyclus nassatus TaxID=53992 RepID=A0AA36DLA1_CYLNA|nr:unnamed protein product [Cylicocyclus nassatus]